tara:strand:+ start:633 stop:851 length:219 start_codon:yes stop_codon:yes gene_type:complete
MSDPAIAYALEAYEVECHPHDPETNTDIEDLGLGWMVTVWIPSSRRSDIDRNAAMREDLSEKIDAAITAAGG